MATVKGTKPANLAWKRPVRDTHHSLGYTYRRYVSRCGEYRVSVRIDGPLPYRFYAERLARMPGKEARYWTIIDNYPHRTKAAAVKACEREARRAAK